MKNLLLAGLLLAIVAGCGPSYRSTPLRHPVGADDRIAVREFTADSPATAQMIRETLVVELKEAGLAVVDVNDSPDLIISGTITVNEAGFLSDRIVFVDSIFLVVTTHTDDFVTSLRCNQIFAEKTPGEIGTQLGKRLAKKFKKKTKAF